MTEGKSADTHLLIRGEKSQRGPLVERRFPVVLAGAAQTPLGKLTQGSGRLELARWIADAKNPLTARVFVNRVWQRLTGRALVGTPNDFGVMGDAPTHPELLDYLAERFIRDGWSVKALVRHIVQSRAYQQASAARKDVLTADPGNALWARMNLRRLTCEQILDSLQAAAGTLHVGPPPASAKKPVGGFRFGQGYRGLYLSDDGVARLFDGADVELLVDQREASVTAPQLLFFLNNRAVAELTGLMARRADKLAGTERAAKVAAAYRLLFGRPPQAWEVQEAERFLQKHSFERFCHLLICANEFIYLD